MCLCVPGYTLDVNAQCQPCSTGSYSNSWGGTECALCTDSVDIDPNSNTARITANSQQQCECIQGYYPHAQTGKCAACPLGSYKEILGDFDCTLCAPCRTTLHEAGFHSKHCLEKPGFRSAGEANGVPTYELCPGGTYNPLVWGECVTCLVHSQSSK